MKVKMLKSVSLSIAITSLLAMASCGGKQEQQQAQPEEQGMTKENAEQILEALRQDEKETLEKVKEQQAKQSKRYRVEKDW